MARQFKIDVGDRVRLTRAPGMVASLGGIERVGDVVAADGDGCTVIFDAIDIDPKPEPQRFEGEDAAGIVRTPRRRARRTR